MIREFTFYSKNEKIIGMLNYETYYITLFIESCFRHHKEFKAKYKSIDKEDKITELIINLDWDKVELVLYKSSKVLECRVTDKYYDIVILRGEKRRDKVLQIIKKASIEFDKKVPGVKDVIDEALERFANEGYRNRWVYAKRRVKGIGTAKLVCEVTMTSFTLDLIVENRQQEIIYQKQLLITLPRGFWYASIFKKLLVDEKYIIVTDRIYERPIFMISIDDMLQGKDGKIFDPTEEFKEIKGSIKIPKEDPKWWAEFKECLKTPEGTPCPSLK